MSISTHKPPSPSNDQMTPAIRIDAEYIQSLVVKNPAVLEIMQKSSGEIETQLHLNVNAHAAGKDMYRVVLQVRLRIGSENAAHLSIDLDYEGRFCITEANESILPIILFVQCPHLLFPAVRQMITNITQNTGLPPFTMQPINFMDMFQQKVQEQGKSRGQ